MKMPRVTPRCCVQFTVTLVATSVLMGGILHTGKRAEGGSLAVFFPLSPSPPPGFLLPKGVRTRMKPPRPLSVEV